MFTTDFSRFTQRKLYVIYKWVSTKDHGTLHYNFDYLEQIRIVKNDNSTTSTAVGIDFRQNCVTFTAKLFLKPNLTDELPRV